MQVFFFHLSTMSWWSYIDYLLGSEDNSEAIDIEAAEATKAAEATTAAEAATEAEVPMEEEVHCNNVEWCCCCNRIMEGVQFCCACIVGWVSCCFCWGLCWYECCVQGR